MKLSQLFYNVLHAPYIHTESGADYALVREGGRLSVYFEASNGATDWKNNIDFPAIRAPQGGLLLVHRGFSRVFESVREPLADAILDPKIADLLIVGYSHGAALATLCYDLAYRLRPDLRGSMQGYGFGSPRVFFGVRTHRIEKRFDGFTVVRNIDDIVTHLPPSLLGYFHVGQLLTIGEEGKYTRIDAHRPEHIMRELLAYEKKNEKALK